MTDESTDQTPPPVGRKKKKDVPGVRFDKRDTVTVQELSAQLKINAATARKKLREAGESLSVWGTWEWIKGSPKLKQVTKLLEGNADDPDRTREPSFGSPLGRISRPQMKPRLGLPHVRYVSV
jgi:hypothetical protein